MQRTQFQQQKNFQNQIGLVRIQTMLNLLPTMFSIISIRYGNRKIMFRISIDLLLNFFVVTSTTMLVIAPATFLLLSSLHSIDFIIAAAGRNTYSHSLHLVTSIRIIKSTSDFRILPTIGTENQSLSKHWPIKLPSEICKHNNVCKHSNSPR